MQSARFAWRCDVVYNSTCNKHVYKLTYDVHRYFSCSAFNVLFTSSVIVVSLFPTRYHSQKLHESRRSLTVLCTSLTLLSRHRRCYHVTDVAITSLALLWLQASTCVCSYYAGGACSVRRRRVASEARVSRSTTSRSRSPSSRRTSTSPASLSRWWWRHRAASVRMTSSTVT